MAIVTNTDNIYGVNLICFDDYMYRHSVAIGRIWDEEVIDILLPHIADDTDVLDIGANIGLVTLGLLQKAEKQGVRLHHVHCFECDPKTFTLLQFNLNHDSRVKMYPFAIGDTQQLCQLSNNPYNQGCNYIYHTTDSNGDTTYDYTAIRTPGADEVTSSTSYLLSVPLDSILYQFKKRISVIKIDIEGFELQALRGAVKLIQMHRPVILVEIWKVNMDAIVTLLNGLGYSNYHKVVNPHYPNQDYIFYPN
jgi:FkbM family methyltransferase